MKASVNKNTGLLIGSQSNADDAAMVANAADLGVLPENVEIRTVNQAELDVLILARTASQMTQADYFKAIDQAFDKHLDAVAAARGYGRVGVTPSASCVGFAGYPNPWQTEAIKFAQWSANCCTLLIQGQNDVISGTRQMPTPEQAIAELPVMVW